MKSNHPWLTWVIVGLFGLYTAYILVPGGDQADSWHYHKFGTLPIQEGGRVKPIETDAFTNLTLVNHRQTVTDPDAKSRLATTWYLDVLTAEMRKPSFSADNKDLERRVVRIDQPALQELLGLPRRENNRYAINEFLDRFRNVLQDAAQLRKKDSLNADEQRILDALDREVPYLIDHMKVVFTLFNLNQKVLRIENEDVLNTLGLKARPGLRYSVSEMLENLEEFFAQAKRASDIDAKKRNKREVKIVELYQHLGMLIRLARHENLHVIPPAAGTNPWNAAWLSPKEAMQAGDATQQKLAERFDDILVAYAQGEKDSFNKAVDVYYKDMQGYLPKVVNFAGLEVYFNDVAPFHRALWMYWLTAMIGCLSWLFWFKTLNRAAFWSTLIIFLLHTWAIVMRMYLQGRPPVTNLYSSAIFIGWGCVGVCLILETLFRNSIPIIVGGVCGALTLQIGDKLGLSGDTLEMMQAVLDTNFWLATHVTCITLGYTACFVAGMMGWAYLFLGLCTNTLRKETGVALSKAIYGVVCFGMFLSFTGTVLGGIWADQSWGRFWGWDPKENGALLIVLWNALILHARWGGMVKHIGMASLAVLGNIITAWSWFGVNMLGVGLHSYGFMEGAFQWLMAWVALNVAVAGLGLVPLKYWRSFAPLSRPTSTSGAQADKMELMRS